jgi:hypothetical protein
VNNNPSITSEGWYKLIKSILSVSRYTLDIIDVSSNNLSDESVLKIAAAIKDTV